MRFRFNGQIQIVLITQCLLFDVAQVQNIAATNLKVCTDDDITRKYFGSIAGHYQSADSTTQLAISLILSNVTSRYRSVLSQQLCVSLITMFIAVNVKHKTFNVSYVNR